MGVVIIMRVKSEITRGGRGCSCLRESKTDDVFNPNDKQLLVSKYLPLHLRPCFFGMGEGEEVNKRHKLLLLTTDITGFIPRTRVPNAMLKMQQLARLLTNLP